MKTNHDQVSGFLVKLFRGVGTARAKRLESLLQRGEWASLQKETLSPPHQYQNAKMYFKDALIVEIARKLLLPGDKRAREAAAQATFWECERQNTSTNARLNRFIDGQGPFDERDLPILDFISRWRAEIASVLGKCPSQVTPRFSQGSTLSDMGLHVTLPDKLDSDPTLYKCDDPFTLRSTNGTPFYSKRHLWRRVEANRFFTVPKDSTKDRGCCVEASLALTLQLGIGEEIISAIERKYKVVFRRLPDYHRWISCLASRFGTFATIDLSNASDTMAWALVRLLLPSGWFTLLNSLRAKFTEIDGRRVRLEKFSSMGNGFTFPLETLIFQTLARTIGSNCSSVFGDDIVIESERSLDMVAALRWFGFEPNSKKTFCEGPFRESCGGDYFNGEPVRAHYLKELPSHPQHWVALANGLRRVDPELTYGRAAWRYCLDQIPTEFKNFVSEPDLGDFAIYDPNAKPRLHFFKWPEPLYAFDRRVGDVVHGWRGKVAIPAQFDLFKHFHFDTALVAASMGSGEFVTVRDQVRGYRTAWVRARA